MTPGKNAVLTQEQFEKEWLLLTPSERAKVQEHMELNQLSAKLVLSQYPHLRHPLLREAAEPLKGMSGDDVLLKIKKPWQR